MFLPTISLLHLLLLGVAQGTSINDATAFALMYGYPLTLYVQTFVPTMNAVGTNAFENEKQTATAASEVLVRPNVDTLYSRAAIDLSSSDIVLTLPNVTDGRFYIVPFYDLFGNNFDNIGSVNNSQPGDYLLTNALRRDDPADASKYKGIIKYPTFYGSIMARILLKNNGSDLETVHELQTQLNLKSIQRMPPMAPPLSSQVLGGDTLSDSALLLPYNFSPDQVSQTLEVLARVAPFNLPEDYSSIAAIQSILRLAGLNRGSYSPPGGVDYSKISAEIQKQFEKLLGDKSNHAFDNNGWFVFLSKLNGNFHPHYTARAYIAWFGYLQLVSYEALYPTYKDPTVQGLGNGMQLGADESYIMTFSKKPPVTGFWSLMAYNSTNYLIPNDGGIYSLGDRSNLTYGDGSTKVYSDTSSDGPFSILIQPADKAPSANWTNNWLPAPAGGGGFTVNLRWYGPTQGLSDGSYQYPIVTKQKTINAAIAENFFREEI